MHSHRYQIRIEGRLGRQTAGWFEGLELEHQATETVLVGRLDQAALHGVLARIRDLGLVLIAVRRIRCEQRKYIEVDPTGEQGGKQ